MWLLRLCWIFVVICTICTEVTIKNNKVEGIVVTISPEIEWIDGFVGRLEEIFDEFSKNIKNSFAYEVKDIKVIIPKSWKDSHPAGQNLHIYGETDFIIEHDKGVFGDNPFTIQPEGCEKPGQRISMPQTFITNSEESRLKGKLLLQEWTQYRYGVFKEHGFLNDNAYPLYYTHPGYKNTTTIINECSHGVSYHLRDKYGDECHPEFDVDTGRQVGHYCYYEPNEDSPSEYSIMSQPFVKSVTQFCGKENKYEHNPERPTKQNILCNERSISLVLRNHPDAKDNIISKDSSSHFTPPTYSYYFLEPLKVVLAIDSSAYMENSMAMIEDHINTFISHDLPRDSELGIIFFYGDHVEEIEKMGADLDKNYYVWSLDKYPDPACVKCAIDKAELMLNNDGVLIIVGSLKSLLEQVENMKIPNIKVFLIIIHTKSTTKQMAKLETFVKKTGGQLFIVFENIDIIQYEKLYSACTHLHHIFTHISQLLIPNKNAIIVQQTISREEATVYFYVPYHLNSLEFRFSNDPYMLYNVRIFNPKNEEVFLAKSGLIQVTSEANPGKWKITLKSNKKNRLLVMGKTPSELSLIKLTTWVSQGDETSPILLFAEIREDIHPVIVDSVTAHVYCNNKIIEGIEFVDDGLGYPDITRRDGIYSAHLNISYYKSIYCTMIVKAILLEDSFTIKGDSHNGKNIRPFGDYPCCGKYVPLLEEEKTGTFNLFSLPISFPILSNKDTLYIGKVNDLQVVKINHHDALVYLQWTDPFSVPTPLTYTIKCSMDRSNLKNQFEDASIYEIKEWANTKGSYIPEYTAYGSEQSIIVNLNVAYENIDPDWFLKKTVIYFAMKVKTPENELGPISNIVSAYVDPTIPDYPEEITDIVTPATIDDGSLEGSDDGPGKIKTIIIIVASILAILIIVILLLVCFILLKKRRSEPKIVESDHDNVPTVSNSLPMTNSSSLNPILSWGADVLIDRYDQIKVIKDTNVKLPMLTTEQLIQNLSNIHHGTPSVASSNDSNDTVSQSSRGSSARKVTQV